MAYIGVKNEVIATRDPAPPELRAPGVPTAPSEMQQAVAHARNHLRSVGREALDPMSLVCRALLRTLGLPE
jgi:hypothetical protein